MTLFFSKLLPLFVYPLGLACIILLITLFLKTGTKWIKIGISVAFSQHWLGGNRWVSISLRRSLEWQYVPPEVLPSVGVIVVLGGGTESVKFPRQIVELNSAGDRMLYAGWLYHQGVAPKLLLSGGYIPWMGETTSSPAEEMGVILEMLDVPEEALLFEAESLNTYENAVKSKEILEREGINRIVLVTSATHMPRAVGLFENQGLSVIPAPTDYTVDQDTWDRLWESNIRVQLLNLLPSAHNLSGTTTALKEYIGIIMYKLRGWM
jgi:uncharacterized SAM-binding protein YcdF (DUF218 family)